MSGLGGNDEIFAASGNDLLIGGAGDDTLFGGVGRDRLRGGDGIDTASYATAASRVDARLIAGMISPGHN